ncbi:MAG: hypothetical protein LBV52_00695, partial [Spirochaetaceae bacterium]|nr:hypothetical protein [Spirochaetaceae bacterium]
MILTKKTGFIQVLLLAALGVISCNSPKAEKSDSGNIRNGILASFTNSVDNVSKVSFDSPENGINPEEYRNTLDLIAEAERSGRFEAGMALAESSIREKAGDFSGAVIAAYKELAWAYSYSDVKGISKSGVAVTKESIADGLRRVREIYSSKNAAAGSVEERALKAADAALLFNGENYKDAQIALTELLENDTEIDSFSKWMLLVCKIKNDEADRSDLGTYSAIRARYTNFPAYWYYGALAFSDGVRADFAETCINLNGRGPYSGNARCILAEFAGIDKQKGEFIFSRMEIENTISGSIKNNDPELLKPL